MKLWVVSMECAGLAEAGGVKNVTYSLCKEFSDLHNKVTLFIPVFACNSWENVYNIEKLGTSDVELCGKKVLVAYSRADFENFKVVFIHNPVFAEKEAVYTYTENEESKNPLHKKGQGHEEALYMDVLFQKGVAAYANFINKPEIPDIIHCQDASTSLLPAIIKENKKFNSTKTVVTIHNAGPFYHHNFTSLGEAVWYTGLATELLEKSMNGKAVEPFLVAANSQAHLTTVSEDYALEITDPQNSLLTDGLSTIFAKNNIQIKGITNGFDFDRYNPLNKNASYLPFEFNPEKGDLDGKLKCRKFFIQNIVNTDNFDSSGVKKFGKLETSSDYTKEIYIAYHGRITSQKGINLLVQAIPAIISTYENVRFVIAGQGDPELEKTIIELTKVYAGKVTFMNGYNRVIARLSSASCDFIVLPSEFEPCGLEDFIAQVFGTIPIAHKTGGLNKIIEGQTGFLYKENSALALVAKISQVLTLFELKKNLINKMIKKASANVRKEYLWKTVIQKKYLPFFKEILKN